MIRNSFGQFQKGENIGEKNPKWKGGKPKCKDCFKQLTNYKGLGRCGTCSKKYFSKENSPHWVNDRTKLKKSEDKMKDCSYMFWRKEVRKRDRNICRLSSSECNGRIESHHIFDWINYPELRYIINNGITLCAFHHPRGREEEKRMIPVLQELLSVSEDIN